MSWNSYIDTVKAYSRDATGKEHIDRACIIGLDGVRYTDDTHPSSFKVTPEEVGTITRCMKSKDFTVFMTSGVKAETVKYNFLREEDKKIVYAKKKDQGSLTIQATEKVIVIAHTAEGAQQGNSNGGVQKICDYLESVGY